MEGLNCSSGKTRFHRLFRGKIDHQRSILKIIIARPEGAKALRAIILLKNGL